MIAIVDAHDFTLAVAHQYRLSSGLLDGDPDPKRINIAGTIYIADV